MSKSDFLKAIYNVSKEAHSLILEAYNRPTYHSNLGLPQNWKYDNEKSYSKVFAILANWNNHKLKPDKNFWNNVYEKLKDLDDRLMDQK